MHIKMWLHYPLLRSLDSYKVRLCFIVLSVTVCTVGYICLCHGDQIFMDFVNFLSTIIYEVLYMWCLRYNICSAWFLDVGISTCLVWILKWYFLKYWQVWTRRVFAQTVTYSTPINNKHTAHATTSFSDLQMT